MDETQFTIIQLESIANEYEGKASYIRKAIDILKGTYQSQIGELTQEKMKNEVLTAELTRLKTPKEELTSENNEEALS